MLYVSVTEAADQTDYCPRNVSDAFYQRRLDDARVINVAGRRAILSDYVPEIAWVLGLRAKTQEAATR